MTPTPTALEQIVIAEYEDGQRFECALSLWRSENEEADPDAIAELLPRMLAGETVSIGGGAEPLCRLRIAEVTTTAHPTPGTPEVQHDPTTEGLIYGTVHYENDLGPVAAIPCFTEVQFQAEIETGSKWVEANPGQYRGVWGERA